MTTTHDSARTDDPEHAVRLRATMARALRERGAARSKAVEAALTTVPRHLFAPEADLEAVYAPDEPVAAKHDDQGRRTSSLSSATTQATMLEQAAIEAGMRVLEIGSGGYNAALIAELVGPSGAVTTVDIDSDITGRARRHLDASGYSTVRVVCADAEFGVAEGAPFDRILVTAGAWDVPPAWVEQLAPHGRLVVPLRFGGLTRTIAFDRGEGRLVSRPDHHLTVFVPMQGAGEHIERGIAVDGDDISLFTAQGPVDAAALRTALRGPRVEAWSGVEFDRPDLLHLWVAGHARRYALLHARPGAIGPGPAGPVATAPVPALLGDDSIAFRAKRPMGADRFETGVYAYGPHAREVAEDYIKLIRAWGRHGGSLARIEVWPAGTPDAVLPDGTVVDKPHTRVVLSWP